MKNAGVAGCGQCDRAAGRTREARDRALVQRHFALLALLGSADVHSAVAQIDVGAVKPERLPGGASR